MSFTKFRDTVAEIKIQVSRAQSYIGILNFVKLIIISQIKNFKRLC